MYRNHQLAHYAHCGQRCTRCTAHVALILTDMAHIPLMQPDAKLDYLMRLTHVVTLNLKVTGNLIGDENCSRVSTLLLVLKRAST